MSARVNRTNATANQQTCGPVSRARTKRLALEVYDAMTTAAETGVPYRTVLDPPPDQGLRHATSVVAVAP